MTVRKKDNGSKDLIKKYEEGWALKIGFVGIKANSIHANSKKTNKQIAYIHEFGLNPHTPKPFFRDWWSVLFNANKVLLRSLNELWKTEKMTKRDVVETFARGVTRQMRASLVRYGLVDTGELRDSISWEEIPYKKRLVGTEEV